MEEIEQFIGPKKVIGLIKESLKTNGGNEIVTVLYDGGSKEIMPLVSFDVLKTEKASDYTDLRKRKINDLTLKILTVVAEHDLKAGEVDELNRSIGMEILNSFNKAGHYLWTKDDKSFTPGINTILERSLLEADIIIKGINDSAK